MSKQQDEKSEEVKIMVPDETHVQCPLIRECVSVSKTCLHDCPHYHALVPVLVNEKYPFKDQYQLACRAPVGLNLFNVHGQESPYVHCPDKKNCGVSVNTSCFAGCRHHALLPVKKLYQIACLSPRALVMFDLIVEGKD